MAVMIEVTCAIIRNDEGKVLVVRRGTAMDNAGKWEFPGGKIKPGETHEDCLIREIHEELGIDIILSGTLQPVEHDYGDKFIKLYPFICDTLASRLSLTEHDDHRWLCPDELPSVDLSAADIPVAVDYASGTFVSSVFQAPEPLKNEQLQTGEETAGIVRNISDTGEIMMMAKSAASDPALLGQLVGLSLGNDDRAAFFASWILSKVADISPGATIPFLESIIDALPGLKNQSVQRSFLRVISKNRALSVPETHRGLLTEYCFSMLRQGTAAVAPKVYSMVILAEMCTVYPEMKNEVASAISLIVNDSSGGIKSQARKLIIRLLGNAGQ